MYEIFLKLSHKTPPVLVFLSMDATFSTITKPEVLLKGRKCKRRTSFKINSNRSILFWAKLANFFLILKNYLGVVAFKYLILSYADEQDIANTYD